MKKLICKSCQYYNDETVRCKVGRILPTKKNLCGIHLERDTEPEPKKPGGPRPGAGRPKIADKKQIRSYALSPQVIDFINNYSRANGLSKSESVELILKSFI